MHSDYILGCLRQLYHIIDDFTLGFNPKEIFVFSIYCSLYREESPGVCSGIRCLLVVKTVIFHHS